MPLPVQNLNPNSTDEEIAEAVRASIEQCIDEGKDAKQCAAIAYRYARDLTGKNSMRLGFAAQGGTPSSRGGMPPTPGGGMPRM